MKLLTPDLCELENKLQKSQQLRSCHSCGRVVCLQCCVPVTDCMIERSFLHPRAKKYLELGRAFAQLVWQPHVVGYGVHAIIYYTSYHCVICNEGQCTYCQRAAQWKTT